MPLTSSNARGAAAGTALIALLLLRAIDGRRALLLRVLARRLLHHRPQQLVVGLVEPGRVAPVLAVPRVDAGRVRAAVVAARSPERLHDAFHAELLDARGIQGQVLRA